MIESNLTDSTFAADAAAIHILLKAVEGASQFIKSWVSLKREDCINLMGRHLSSSEFVFVQTDVVILLEMVIYTSQNHSPHRPFALFHRGLLVPIQNQPYTH